MVGDGFAGAVMDGLLAAFCRDYPGVHVTLSIGSASEIVRALVDDDCHLGFTLSAPHHPSVRAVRERARPIRVVAAPSHPVASMREPIRLAALRSHALALAADGAGLQTLVQMAAEEEGVELPACFTADRVDTLRRYAMAGLGVTFLSERAVADELLQGRLVARRTTSTVLESNRAQVLIRTGRSPSAPLRELLKDLGLIDTVL
jgi:DNA-binding transcriptional LysR family regulator